MGIPLRVLEQAPALAEREPGMMWRRASEDEAGRESWWICLPDPRGLAGAPGHPSQISWRTTDRGHDAPHEMWDVIGTPPLITVSPSIDVLCFVLVNGQSVRDGSYWHGHIVNGELVG